MEKQAVIIENDLKTIVFKYISGLFQLVDIAIFKIVIDYIVRNFDPTGINIGGLIDSFYHVFIKPSLSWFVKMIKRVVNHYHGLSIKLHKTSTEAILHSVKVLYYKHGCLKE
jgi:hypothetical protein